MGPYTVIPEDYADGSCSADVMLDGISIGTCVSGDRMALEEKAIRLAQLHFQRMVDKARLKP